MKRTVIIVVAALATTLAVGPAEASPEAEGQHCVTMLVPLEPIGGPTLAELEPIGCFPTYDQALEAGSGSAIDVPADTSPQTLTDETAALLSTSSSVLIGTEYDGSNFGGGSQSYFAASTCAGVSWSVANVGSEWNDRFQSGKGFGGCDTNRKFQHENFAGDVRTCTPNCADYGALENEVTSLRWRP
jgi:hypothetical protein